MIAAGGGITSSVLVLKESHHQNPSLSVLFVKCVFFLLKKHGVHVAYTAHAYPELPLTYIRIVYLSENFCGILQRVPTPDIFSG